MISALGASMVASYLPASARGKRLAFIALMTSIGLVIGAFLVGVITEYWSWN